MSDTISRKGVFIPDITVEMFRNASLESIEDLMASGEMEDILLPSAQPDWLPDMLFVDTKTGEVLGKIHRGEGLEPLQKKAHSTDKED